MRVLHWLAVFAAGHAANGHFDEHTAQKPKQRHHLGPPVSVSATSYSPCSSSGSHTADGTPVGKLKSWGHVAVPQPGRYRHLPLGTLIRLTHPLHGRRYFRAKDYIGAFSELDFFDRDCGRASRFGRKRLVYRVVLHRRGR